MGIEKYYVPQSKANICFDCQNACGGCSWSEKFEPVPGWTAKKVTQKTHLHKGAVRWIETYHITACPEFVKDEPRHSMACGEITDEQMRRLIQHWRRRGEL